MKKSLSNVTGASRRGSSLLPYAFLVGLVAAVSIGVLATSGDRVSAVLTGVDLASSSKGGEDGEAPGLVITVADAGASEGDLLVFAITVDPPAPPAGLQLDWTVIPQTAGPNDIDGPLAGTLELQGGESSATVELLAANDNLWEGADDETFSLEIRPSDRGIQALPAMATGRIADTDVVTLTMQGTFSVTEGGPPSQIAIIPDIPLERGFFVAWTLSGRPFFSHPSGDIADPRTDMTEDGGFLTLPSGTGGGSFSIQAVDDNEVEPTVEYLNLFLTTPAPRVNYWSSRVVAVIDND